MERKNAEGKKERYQQQLLPDHCVRDSRGAELVIAPENDEWVQQKGTHRKYESYSAVQDGGGRDTGLLGHLHSQGIEAVVLVGLAADVCGLYTAADLAAAGLRVYVVPELC